MTDGWLGGELAEKTSELFAHAHDDFHHGYQNTRWTQTLLERAEAAGLQGDHLLDVGCGTGLSFIPMLRRGWAATGCDISREMLEIARAKVGDLAVLRKADMRELPVLGSFDLVWSINCAMNYLLSPEELIAALVGIKRNLAPGGVVVFDLNTLATYRTFFAQRTEVKIKRRHLVWTGRVQPETAHPGLIAEARFEALGEPGSVHLHQQRHFPEAIAREAIEVAGLVCVEVAGELAGSLHQPLCERVHGKAVYVCVVGAEESSKAN